MDLRREHSLGNLICEKDQDYANLHTEYKRLQSTLVFAGGQRFLPLHYNSSFPHGSPELPPKSWSLQPFLKVLQEGGVGNHIRSVDTIMPMGTPVWMQTRILKSNYWWKSYTISCLFLMILWSPSPAVVEGSPWAVALSCKTQALEYRLYIILFSSSVRS